MLAWFMAIRHPVIAQYPVKRELAARRIHHLRRRSQNEQGQT